ncbi:GRIP1-associated protein 1-like [Fundulus heteroclitus]|uniref:GRIP1-associated protein 1-like n=1 Tax=Fundulus heteroclitus TaxID=8078 RepID=UPI00165AB3D5|nr:GRIP1-associated protein 1-like [Fundulus heteroclitus]
MEYQQQGWGGGHHQRGWIDNRQPANVFQGDIQRLGSLLEMERARWFEENQKVAALEKELEDAKHEVKRQKNLKEMYINKGKETKRELMSLQKFSDPESLSPAIIASKVHSTMKYKKKKLLQQDFEHLKVAHVVNEELFVAQIEAEKERNNTLQQELDKVKLSYEQLRSEREADNAGATLQVDMQKVYEDKIKQDQTLIENLRAEKDDLFQTMSYEIAVLQEKKKCLKSEMEQLKVSYQELNLKYETEVSALRQQAEAHQQEMNREKEANSERAKNDLQLINDLKAEKDNLHQKMTQEFGFLQQQSAENTKHLQRELEQVKVSYQELKNRYELDVSAHRQQAEVFEQQLDEQIKDHSQKMKDNLKFINQLKAEKDALHQQLTVLQQRFSGCEVNYKTELENLKAELQDRDDLGPPKRKRARRQEPSMDLDRLLEETLSEPVEYPEASPMELDNFVEEMLKDLSILDPEAREVPELPGETLPENQQSQDPEPMQVEGSQPDPSVWKKIRHTLGLKKPKKWKKSKNTSQNEQLEK